MKTDLSRAQEKRMAKTHARLANEVGFTVESHMAAIERTVTARREGERTAHLHALTLAIVNADSHANYIYRLNRDLETTSPGEANEIEVLAIKLERIAKTLRGRVV